MVKDKVQRSVDFLQAASKAKAAGLDRPGALLAAYREELGERYEEARALAECLPEQLGEPDLCDIFAVTFAIISTLTGAEGGCQKVVARLRKEYGGSGCGLNRRETPLCTCRMKDCVLLIEWARSQQNQM